MTKRVKKTVPKNSTIDLDQARAHVLADLAYGVPNWPSGENALSPDYLEAPNCWMFFLIPEVLAHFAGTLNQDVAYAVSKRGELRSIPDLSADRTRLMEYLRIMSDHFHERGL